MAIPDSFLDDLNSRLNIVDVVSAYVPLTKRGGNYWGLCPFHHEKTPSFSVNESRQIFHCFGCGKGGGPARFLMEMESLSFPDAVRKLADQAGLPMPEDTGGPFISIRKMQVETGPVTAEVRMAGSQILGFFTILPICSMEVPNP